MRGHVLGETFLIGVPNPPAARVPRTRIEDRLLEEARSLIRLAEAEKKFDFANHHFEFNKDFGVWEKRLSDTEVDQLLRD